MPCDTRLKKNQTVAQRVTEVRKAAERIDKMLAARKVTAKVGPQGAVAFLGLSEADRDGLTDACIYRRIMASGSAASKMALTRAEQMAGRSIDRAAVSQGTHSHDGGNTWHARG